MLRGPFTPDTAQPKIALVLELLASVSASTREQAAHAWCLCQLSEGRPLMHRLHLTGACCRRLCNHLGRPGQDAHCRLCAWLRWLWQHRTGGCGGERLPHARQGSLCRTCQWACPCKDKPLQAERHGATMPSCHAEPALESSSMPASISGPSCVYQVCCWVIV